MGKGSDRNEVDPGLRHLAHVPEADAAGSFQFRSGGGATRAGDPQRNGCAQFLRAHVVEQDAIGPGGDRLLDLGAVLGFDLDRQAGMRRAAGFDRRSRPAGDRDV